MRLMDGGKLARNAFQERPLFRRTALEFLGFFLGLNRFPVLDNFLGGGSRLACKNMRMAPDELVGDFRKNRVDIKTRGLFSKLGVEDDVKKQIPEFFGETVEVFVLNSLQYLVNFLDQHGLQGIEILLLIPGATIRAAQCCHDLNELFEFLSGHARIIAAFSCYIHTPMKVVTSLSDLDSSKSSVVSIGNFDGLHLGHRAILNAVVRRASELGLQSAVMTFSPHPVRFLAPDRAPKLISTLDQKIRLIASTGIDHLFVVNFDAEFSRLSPEEFIHRYLIEGLKAGSVCVGSNFNFGYQQRGRIETLRQFQPGLEVIEVPEVRVRGMVASSSQVRRLVEEGAVSHACRLLGRWVEIEGQIVSGAGRGKSVTVPTLNLKTGNELLPKIGVYVTRISLDGQEYLDSVTNVGVRPTFEENDLTIETFVLNDVVPPNASSGRLDFLWRVRDEVKFESPGALRQQIAIDVQRAQTFFRRLRRDRYVRNHPN